MRMMRRRINCQRIGQDQDHARDPDHVRVLSPAPSRVLAPGRGRGPCRDLSRDPCLGPSLDRYPDQGRVHLAAADRGQSRQVDPQQDPSRDRGLLAPPGLAVLPEKVAGQAQEVRPAKQVPDRGARREADQAQSKIRAPGSV